MAGQPRYKTELFIPIKKDTHTFEERQKDLWGLDRQDSRGSVGSGGLVDDVHSRMELRRRAWEDEVERMRKDFFRLKPDESRRDSSENLLDRMNLDDLFFDDPRHQGQKRFQVGFDVKEFRPEEVSVRTQDNKLIVHAKHEERGEGRNLSREFSKNVDIPSHVDPNSLSCIYTQDGVLQIEAPVSAPTYDAIRGTSSPLMASPPYSPTSPSYQQAAPYKPGGSMTETDGSQKLKMAVDVGHDYRPDEILVKTVDRKLVVSARHEEKSEGRSSTKQFSREFDLPANVDPNQVSATLGDDGRLIVEAPLSNYSKGAYSAPVGSTRPPPRIGVTIRKIPRQ